jgi:2'-hydroxyisoflavone reductase
MRILIMGGTAFVGRHIAQAALDNGHEITLFHRGVTGAELFPQARHLTADRNEDLSALATGSWDATIDVSAYVPRQVRALAAALDGRGGAHLLISSTSVYQTPVAAGFGEDAPLAQLGSDGRAPDGRTAEDLAPAEMTGENYGALKVACERAAVELHGPATTIIRPTYVIGPHDHSYRFTWWVERIARGGEVLAPGDPADPIQVIDARDMGAWAITLLEKQVSGTFHAASPPPPFGFGDMLAAIAARIAPAGTTFTWVDNDFLLGAGVTGERLPLWPGGDSEHDINAADPAAALAAGLNPRSLGDSTADVHAQQAASPTAVPDGLGITAHEEAGLLRGWAAR